MYALMFAEGWDACFEKLDKAIQRRIISKLEQLRGEIPSRRFKHAPIFVEEVGQYRICFKIDELGRSKTFYFVGDHKEYERWYSGMD